MGFLWNLSKFSIKVALVAGAVKLSIDSDVWSLNNSDGAHLYNNLKQYIIPGTIVFPKTIPSVEEMKFNSAQCWNSGVDRVFTAVENAPASLRTIVNRTINNE